ncbi:MAG: signal peptidase I [Acetivibrio ethanolgignens]
MRSETGILLFFRSYGVKRYFQVVFLLIVKYNMGRSGNTVNIVKKRFLSKYDGKKYEWFKGMKNFCLLLFLVFLIFQLLIGISFVKGDSMEPTLKNGEMVFYRRFGSTYERGDIVSVRVPAGEYYVKRVIAVEGDTVDIKEGKVYVNGNLLDEPYVAGDTYEQKGTVEYPYTLEENQIFVLGDNREVSMDSRTFGPVSRRQIKGKLLFYAGKFYILKL